MYNEKALLIEFEHMISRTPKGNYMSLLHKAGWLIFDNYNAEDSRELRRKLNKAGFNFYLQRSLNNDSSQLQIISRVKNALN